MRRTIFKRCKRTSCRNPCLPHFLGHALQDIGGFGVPLEYLNLDNFDGWKARFGDKRLPALIDDFIRHRTSPNGRFGLKAHWSQFRRFVDGPKLTAITPFTHVIHLYRSDILGQAISFLKASQTGQWISGAPATGTARYDYAKLVKFAENLHAQNFKWAAYLGEAYPGCVKRVEYSALIKNQVTGLRDVALFLEPDMDVTPAASEKTKRQSDSQSGQWRDRFLADLRDEDAWICDPLEMT